MSVFLPVVEGGLGVSSPEKGPWVRFLVWSSVSGCTGGARHSSHPPTVLYYEGLHYIHLRAQAWEVIGFFLPLPSPDKQPGPRGSSSKSPHCCCRALVWPPSSSPDSVHSLLPVSLPPRHSLPHVARGIFLKRTSGYFPSLHKSFRDALWPAG